MEAFASVLNAGPPVNPVQGGMVVATTRVAADGCCSESRDVLCGVPQGWVLCQVLFVICINYVTDGVVPSFKAFTDDYRLYLT